MSYILDAIRKSEHERQMREAPTLSTLPNVSSQTPKRPVWFWPIIILMILNLAALAFWFWYKNNSVPTLKIDTQTAAITPTQKTITAKSKQPPIIANKAIPTEVAKKSKVPEKQSQSIADMLKTPPSIPQQTPAKPQPIPKKIAAAQPERPKFATIQQPAKMTAPIQARAQQQPVAQKQASAIPYLHTLSQDFQDRVPPLKMNIHMYSDNAKDSFAIINMTKYRSGEIISEGLKLEKITSKGLVLSFDDQRFQLNHP